MKRYGIPLLAAAIALSACTAFQREKPGAEEKKPAAADLKMIGRIASVPPDKRFVLIQSYDKSKIEAGTILTTRGDDGRSANLKITGERMGQFAAADVQSGSVVLGDAVYSLHVPKPATEASETAAPDAENPPSDPLPPPPPGLPGEPELPENQPITPI